MFKKLIFNLKYNWSFLRVINSPFRGLKLTWYFGKIKHGTPYFLPRKWVKMTKEDAIKAADKDVFSKYPNLRPYDELVAYYMRHKKAVPIKYFGINYAPLGWKTKWQRDDYRFEWSPCLSIVLFGKQLFISILPNLKNSDRLSIDCYWEAWLEYDYETDKSLSKTERVKDLLKRYPHTWNHWEKDQKDKEISVNHYKHILKDKYLYLITD